MFYKVKNFSQSKFLKLKKKDAQTFLDLLKKNLKNEKFVDKSKRVLSEGEFVLFPLIQDSKKIKSLTEYIDNKFFFEIIKLESQIALDSSQSIEDILKKQIPSNIINLIPKSYDIIGHIAVVEFNRFRDLSYRKALQYKKKFAKALLLTNNAIKSIYEKKSEIQGKFRLRDLKLLKGEDKTEAIYRENNCIFNLDIKKTYFSPRLVYERKRLANCNIKAHEVIIDMFAGVGPISIQLVKNHNVQIYAFDINPIAYKYLKQNICLNNMMGQIFPFNINVTNLLNPKSDLGNELKHKASRIIMNLPEKSLKFIRVACFLMKLTGGMIHSYQFVNKPRSIEKAIENLKISLEKSQWNIDKITECRIVKPFSPKMDLVVVDSIIRPFY